MIPAATWPHETLGWPTVDGYAVTPGPRTVRLELAEGPAVYRKVPGRPTATVSVRWVWTQAAYGVAVYWLEQHGRDWFRLQLRVDGAPVRWVVAHIIDEPVHTLDPATGHWVTTAELEVEIPEPGPVYRVGP